MKDLFIISSLLLAISFFIILIINTKVKSKTIKYLFLILSLIFLVLITIFDNHYVYLLLKSLITYIWYPNYLIFVSSILISNIILIYTCLNNKLSIKRKIINYLIFSISYTSYIIFSRLNIDINSYSSLYQNNSLTILRIETISFLTWFILTIIFKLIDRSSYEK